MHIDVVTPNTQICTLPILLTGIQMLPCQRRIKRDVVHFRGQSKDSHIYPCLTWHPKSLLRHRPRDPDETCSSSTAIACQLARMDSRQERPKSPHDPFRLSAFPPRKAPIRQQHQHTPQGVFRLFCILHFWIF